MKRERRVVGAEELDERLSGGALLDAISNHIAQVFAEQVGRGPSQVRTYLNEQTLLCLMQDTMTRGEQTLFEAGRGGRVLEVRSDFQETMEAKLIEGIEALTGREVVAFLSANNLQPDLVAEVFVLNGRPG
jgi:uncharacterized protein YbcI